MNSFGLLRPKNEQMIYALSGTDAAPAFLKILQDAERIAAFDAEPRAEHASRAAALAVNFQGAPSDIIAPTGAAKQDTRMRAQLFETVMNIVIGLIGTGVVAFTVWMASNFFTAFPLF